MTVNRCDDFLSCLREARVVPQERVEALLSQVQFDEPRTLALAFVRAGLLTDWQAKFLLSGRSRMHVGNYVLQDRIRRDELGDLFLAWHEPLHRRVELQILPEEISRESNQFSAFIDSTSRLTKLDHPRLAHLYDVDQERGRYYIIGEHVPGRTVKPSELAGLSQLAAGRLLHDISAALSFLHRRELAHGKISADAIQLDENEHGKVVGLAPAVLSRDLGFSSSPPVAQIQQRDLADWTELARKLVVRYFGGNDFLSWRDLVEQFVDEPTALDEFARAAAHWLRQNDTGAAHADLELLADAEQTFQKSEPKSEPIKAGESIKPGEPKHGSTASIARQGQSEHRTSTAWQIYLVALAILVAAGFLGYFLWKNVGQRSRLATSSEQLTVDRQVPDPRGIGNSKTSDSGNRKPRSTKRKATSETGLQVGVDEVQGENPSQSKTESGKGVANSPPDFSTNAESTEVKGVPPSAIDTQNDTPATSVPGSGKLDLASEVDPSNTANSGQEKDPFKIPNRVEMPDSKTNDPQANSDQGSRPEVTPILPGEPPFSRLADCLAISSVEQKAEQALGVVRLADPKVLRLELVYKPETVSRIRTHFFVEANTDKPSWIVTCKRRPEEPASQPVGSFDLVNGQLTFRWDEAVDGKSPAAALVNCVLRLSTASGDSKLITLRQPLTINGLVLDPKSLSIEIPLELVALPNGEAIRFEFGPFPKGTPWENGLVENDTFERKMPAVILFRMEQTEQAFAVAVNREFKSKLELSCQWVALGGERPKPLRKPEFVAILDGLENNYAQMVAISEKANLDAENAVTGTKTASRERAKKIEDQKDEAKRINDLGNFYREKLEAIAKSDIPLRIFYDCDGQAVLLAKTPTADAVAVEPDKPERRKRDE